MNDSDLDAIRDRVDAATPGPWVDATKESAFTINGQTHTFIYVQAADTRTDIAFIPDIPGEDPHDHPDAVFIANARQDICDLLDYIEFLTAAD